MKLTADSGSTKTAWLLSDGGEAVLRFVTGGLNPVVMGLEEFREKVKPLPIPPLKREGTCCKIREIEFYGAGCTEEMCPKVAEIFRELFPEAEKVTVGSDMLGAAKALCGDKEGVAAILGTGANSCLYDGEKIVQNTPPLGYILGDEGGADVLGKLLLNGIYKRTLPDELITAFETETLLTKQTVIQRVYREPQANRFLASLSPFVHKHLDCIELRQIVIDNFRQFFRKNIKPYARPDLPVNFVGSIAFYYEKELKEAASLEGFEVGRILKEPLGEGIKCCKHGIV